MIIDVVVIQSLQHLKCQRLVKMNNIVGDQYKHLKIDTVEWSKANHSLDQQKAITQFMINKYLMRNKNQDKDDLIKIKYYLNWLEDIIKDD